MNPGLQWRPWDIGNVRNIEHLQRKEGLMNRAGLQQRPSRLPIQGLMGREGCVLEHLWYCWMLDTEQWKAMSALLHFRFTLSPFVPSCVSNLPPVNGDNSFVPFYTESM